ncbi:ABC transporter permease [Acidiphilium acidophilum]|uniref:ABC transporter permease n=1 Tax=Acidiphilium acidophilum TaxID=76588 RepID=UPI002E8E749D|nr:ABC transporter permease [Acidiphilium acidophilum]
MDQQTHPRIEIETRPRGAGLLRFVRQLAFALISIAVLIVVFGILNPRFLSPINWFHITQQVAVIAILAIGQTFIIATAGIDISQGSVVALSSMICAIIIVDTHLGIVAGIVLTLALGALIGAIIGGSIVILGVPPFIATLGMLAIALGSALLTTNGTPVFGLPDGFQVLSQGTLLGFPNMGWIAVVIAVIAAYGLNKTRFGRYTLAIGSNAEAARRVGINVPRHLMLIYILGGTISALAGIVYLSYTAAAQPTSGANYELYAIAAVVIGGGSLFGGVGTILGSILGALLMTILKNGTQLAGISSYVEEVILGIVVIGAVYIDNLRRRLR